MLLTWFYFRIELTKTFLFFGLHSVYYITTYILEIPILLDI